MALEAKLLQKLSQSLLMTPQLQQAIKLLQLGRLEYQEAIERELLENPVLEELKEEIEAAAGKPSDSNETPIVSAEAPESRSEDESVVGDNSAVSWEDYVENLVDYRGSASPRGLMDEENRPSIEATLTKNENLVDHLLEQARLADVPQEERSVLLHIVGNLDKDGYLCCTYDEIAEACKCEVNKVEKAMSTVRSFDPPGVGARNLSECLLIQLENMGLGEALPARIIQNHLDKLEKRKFDQIAKLEKVAVDEVYKAVTAIQALEPRPGRQYTEDPTRYVVPDIYVYKDGTQYVISLNEDGLPKLRISPYYLDLLRNKDPENKANHEYLSERLKAASWLIRSIHQRQHTIYRVTESIVKFQREFLDHGISKLKPLVLKDVADDIGMHESTVSRVTTNKYVHTPQGVFELKYFFTAGIKGGEGDVSSSSVKERIRNLIAAETGETPLSDQELVEILKKEGVIIARRTVAKYRESLGILSSSKRKKLF